MNTWLTVSLFLGALALTFAVLWLRELASRRERERAARQSLAIVRQEEGGLGQRFHWLEMSLAAADDLLLALSFDLNVLYANPAAEAAFGPASHHPSLIVYTQELELEEKVLEVLGAGEREPLERIVRMRQRAHRMRIVVLADGIALALRDVSQVQRLTRARQDMIANLSHELRTPLTSLRLLADTLISRLGDDPDMMRRLSEKVVAEVDTLQQMAQEMLDLSAIESGQQAMRLIAMPLPRLVSGPLETLQAQAARRGIELQVAVDENLTVQADPDQAPRAIQNVLHNAIKFTPQGGKIRLEASPGPESGTVVLRVIDSGAGISPHDLERIFERFYRGDRSRGTPGTGLGLAIARHILRAHGGEIWAENRDPPDHGAIFHLAFQAA